MEKYEADRNNQDDGLVFNRVGLGLRGPKFNSCSSSKFCFVSEKEQKKLNS